MKDKSGTSNIINSLKYSIYVGIYKGHARHQLYALIDPGVENDFVGRDGWHILNLSDETNTLNETLIGMGSKLITKFDSVNSVKYHNSKVILIGVGGAEYDRKMAQYKYLWNSHHMRSNVSMVEDKSKDVSGSQLFKVGDNSGSWVNIPDK